MDIFEIFIVFIILNLSWANALEFLSFSLHRRSNAFITVTRKILPIIYKHYDKKKKIGYKREGIYEKMASFWYKVDILTLNHKIMNSASFICSSDLK